MKKLTFAATLFAATIVSAHAASIGGLVNTGQSFSPGDQDTNYALVVTQGNTILSSSAGYVAADGSFPLGPWLANSASSKWLTPMRDQAASLDPADDGVYKWTLQFNLAGYNAASASFTGRFSADNSAKAYLNGAEIGSAAGYDSWSSFGTASGFHAGLNTIDFYVRNLAQDSSNPTGVRVEFLQSSVAAVPEPETYAMLLAGLGLLGLTVRRRKA